MDEVSLPSLAGLIPGDAAALDAEARLKQAQAQHCETSFAAAKLTAEAEGLLALARQLRDPPADLPGVRLGRGGEVSPLPQPRMPVAMGDVAQAIHSPPDMLAAEASLSRLSLAREAGVLTEAVDAAESIGAEGAIEQMLVHAITAAHRVSMQLMAAAGTALRVHEHARHTQGATALLEANRSALAAAG